MTSAKGQPLSQELVKYQVMVREGGGKFIRRKIVKYIIKLKAKYNETIK